MKIKEQLNQKYVLKAFDWQCSRSLARGDNAANCYPMKRSQRMKACVSGPARCWHHLSVLAMARGSRPARVKYCVLCGRFSLEEPPGTQRVYCRPGTPPPTKVTVLSDKEQKEWVKDTQGITEQ